MVAGEITVAGKMVPNIEFDSHIDNLSSVGSKGLKHQLEMDTMCADERDDQDCDLDENLIIENTQIGHLLCTS